MKRARAASIERSKSRPLRPKGRAIVAMRHAGEIPDEIYRSIEYDLDLATLRLS